MLNPLDIITALFLCSDGFLQQEMSLKMSMCQFSVPLLLSNHDMKQCTLMLWAMRDIVKKYRPQSLSESKGFIEDRIVLSELPMISFVRLGECSLSKSEILNKILNKLLSNSQQYHDTFVHRNMECGDSPRRISNGLTEITWYLPCGNTNIDIFSQPVAVANLRGDIASFETQYSFLCQTSAAVFVFFDHLDSECSLLTNQHHKAQIFLVGNYESQSFSLDTLETVATMLGLTNNNIIIKTKQKNSADFVKGLRKTISDVVENSQIKMQTEQMAEIAHELGILVDEDSPECQTAKTNAEAITAEIQDIHIFKEDQLPRQDCGKEPFKYTAEGFYNKFKHKLSKMFNIQDHTMAVQQLADSIINFCTQFVSEKMESRNNYHETYIQEILHMIDGSLQYNHDVKTDIEFEVSLKQHICGFAAREFQKMHEDFIQANDPYRCLMKNKEKFREDFKDIFNKRDQCQKKAEEFTNKCLKPAVEDFVNRSLGPNIIDDMLTCEQFSTRMSFQYSVLLDLLSKNDLKNYLSYIFSYEDYVKTWIYHQIVERYSNVSTAFEFEDRHLQSCIRSINDAINKAKTGKSHDLKTFVESIRKDLDKLVISQDAFDAFMILNNADKEQFADWLTVSVNDMGNILRSEFKKSNFERKLKQLNMKPHNELFTRVIGCGKQCPFCGVPCEAGGGAHYEHFASLHRPQGLGSYSITNGKYHPYKCYKEMYPDWNVPPDASLEASDYWKYVMAKYNKEFASAYNARPADIPAAWKNITKQQATESLKVSFWIK
ncbi:interferon-induced very large GTPase 1-like [Pundamilia nyererei]|uniref:Interferon-induced very large GTPase 1-like n=1 Tax=Pundamilia nyererei TaxID=303518 RepID=A0A9Y3W1B9_9CICH|nr:PREDICTED: interferon-induced very large GTPase 1-like [Pundamilia nyererei]